MSGSRKFTFFVVLLALGACAGPALYVDYNRAGLWANYHTYNMMAQPRAEDIGSLAENPNNRTSIEDAVNWAMKNRGMVQDEQNPDLLVAYYAGKQDAIDPSVWGYSYSPEGSYKDEQGPPNSYKSNTIVIDLVDAKSKELMWRGWSAGVVDAPNNDKTENSIRDVVKKIMAEYPPR